MSDLPKPGEEQPAKKPRKARKPKEAKKARAPYGPRKKARTPAKRARKAKLQANSANLQANAAIPVAPGFRCAVYSDGSLSLKTPRGGFELEPQETRLLFQYLDTVVREAAPA